jgi:hypothetical protein
MADDSAMLGEWAEEIIARQEERVRLTFYNNWLSTELINSSKPVFIPSEGAAP